MFSCTIIVTHVEEELDNQMTYKQTGELNALRDPTHNFLMLYFSTSIRMARAFVPECSCCFI